VKRPSASKLLSVSRTYAHGLRVNKEGRPVLAAALAALAAAPVVGPEEEVAVVSAVVLEVEGELVVALAVVLAVALAVGGEVLPRVCRTSVCDHTRHAFESKLPMRGTLPLLLGNRWKPPHCSRSIAMVR
jgi:hypothetical protein